MLKFISDKLPQFSFHIILFIEEFYRIKFDKLMKKDKVDF